MQKMPQAFKQFNKFDFFCQIKCAQKKNDRKWKDWKDIWDVFFDRNLFRLISYFLQKTAITLAKKTVVFEPGWIRLGWDVYFYFLCFFLIYLVSVIFLAVKFLKRKVSLLPRDAVCDKYDYICNIYRSSSVCSLHASLVCFVVFPGLLRWRLFSKEVYSCAKYHSAVTLIFLNALFVCFAVLSSMLFNHHRFLIMRYCDIPPTQLHLLISLIQILITFIPFVLYMEF